MQAVGILSIRAANVRPTPVRFATTVAAKRYGRVMPLVSGRQLALSPAPDRMVAIYHPILSLQIGPMPSARDCSSVRVRPQTPQEPISWP